jgi:LPXTG-motif cell wall-anchored protein
MKRLVTIGALVALVTALALPAGAAGQGKASFALKGEARGLELAIGDQGVTLGFALSKVDSTPSALGVGAGQCELLGADSDESALPCSQDNTVTSAYPGDAGSDDAKCLGSLPAPLSDIVDLKVACGSSKSGVKQGVAFTSSFGKVAGLNVKLPVGLRMVPLDIDVNQVDQIVSTITDTLAPVLGVAPAEIREVLEGAEQTVDDTTDTAQETVDGLLEIIQGLDATDALAVELGSSFSKVTRSGSTITSESDAAGARIGVLGIPSVGENGQLLQAADPLENGLVIIEVGTARASAAVDRLTAASTSAASPALVTVKVRDITSPTPKYVEVSVAPGETVTILEGTPAESTITAADSTTTQEAGSASAVADAVRLHLLKGVNGGVSLGIAGANAAATAEVVKAAPPVAQNRPPRTLPLTGAEDMTLVALGLMTLAGGAIVARRRFSSN